jgi:hypothetical protein
LQQSDIDILLMWFDYFYFPEFMFEGVEFNFSVFGSKSILYEVADAHPTLRNAGEGEGRPALVVGAQKRWNSFMTTMP